MVSVIFLHGGWQSRLTICGPRDSLFACNGDRRAGNSSLGKDVPGPVAWPDRLGGGPPADGSGPGWLDRLVVKLRYDPVAFMLSLEPNDIPVYVHGGVLTGFVVWVAALFPA